MCYPDQNRHPSAGLEFALTAPQPGFHEKKNERDSSSRDVTRYSAARGRPGNVSRLRCLATLHLMDPARQETAGWANFCRAYGAGE